MMGRHHYRKAVALLQSGRQPGDPECVAVLERACADEYGPALYALAKLYLHGSPGIARDRRYAVSLLRKAVRKGIRSAMHDLAVCYAKGAGTRRNDRRALNLYLRASRRGNRDSQFTVASYFYYGTATRRSFKQAFKWYSRSAKKGHAEAQFALGYMYEMGHGVRRDRGSALRWYALASMKGIDSANKNYKRLLEELLQEGKHYPFFDGRAKRFTLYKRLLAKHLGKHAIESGVSAHHDS